MRNISNVEFIFTVENVDYRYYCTLSQKELNFTIFKIFNLSLDPQAVTHVPKSSSKKLPISEFWETLHKASVQIRILKIMKKIKKILKV